MVYRNEMLEIIENQFLGGCLLLNRLLITNDSEDADDN